MRKAYLPQNRVLGATPVLDSITGMRVYEFAGSSLRRKSKWNMPEPLYYAEHKNKMRVPIYRGIAAKMANHYRSQARREVRKQGEKNAIQET